MVSTTAAPVCRTSGAASVANQMAAVATIKAGFSRFIVGGFGTEDNTRLVTTGPTYATTTGSFNQLGGTVYGRTNTQFGGQTTFLAGNNSAEMRVIMLNPGDQGYEDGLDPRTVLGPEWEKKVKDGINSCF